LSLFSLTQPLVTFLTLCLKDLCRVLTPVGSDGLIRNRNGAPNVVVRCVVDRKGISVTGDLLESEYEI
jgi:hypothetical protein